MSSLQVMCIRQYGFCSHCLRTMIQLETGLSVITGCHCSVSCKYSTFSPVNSTAQLHTSITYYFCMCLSVCGIVDQLMVFAAVMLNTCSCGNLYVCLSVCNTITFNSLDLDSSCLVCRYLSWGSGSYMKVIELRSRSQDRKRVKCDGSTGRLQ